MNNKKNALDASVLIYVLFLVTLAITFASIVLDNFSYLSEYTNYSDIEKKLYENIKSRSKLFVERNNFVNSNGSGFIDNIRCPQSIVMSGTTQTATISSSLTKSGTLIYCSGTYQSNNTFIYFNTGFTDFTEAEYLGSLVALSSGSGTTAFTDSDSTTIDFSAYNYLTGDLIDDNFDSDNYMGNSTGSTAYPSLYEDDDNLGRKQIFGFISPDLGFAKVFWSTTELAKFISRNTNNNDSLNEKLGNVTSARLYFDIDKPYELKLLKFDKTIYDDTGELIPLETITGSGATGKIGYLQTDGSLSESISGSEYDFDFKNNDYAVFLKSSTTDTLFYQIVGETASGTGIYIVGIDDSRPNFIRFLGNELIIGESGEYIPKHAEVIYSK